MFCYRKRLEAPHNISLVCLSTTLHITHLSALHTWPFWLWQAQQITAKPDLCRQILQIVRQFHVHVKERMARNQLQDLHDHFCSCLVSLIFLPLLSVSREDDGLCLSHCWLSLRVYWVWEAHHISLSHTGPSRTNASMLHNVLKHEQTLIALLSEHTGGLVRHKNRTLLCVVD